MANFNGQDISSPNLSLGDHVVPIGVTTTPNLSLGDYVVPTGVIVVTGDATGASSLSFIVTAFDPLRGGIISRTQNTLKLNISQTPGILNPSQITITVNAATIYLFGSFIGNFASSSSVVDLGGGVFQFSLVNSINWTPGSTNEVRVYFPGESP